MTKRERLKRVERAQVSCLFNVEFFAPGIMRLVHEITSGQAPTAATDGVKVLWDEAWLDKLPDKCVPTVLCHEASHCLLGHVWRKGSRDAQLWNIACDHEVNLMLQGYSSALMAKGRQDPFPFPEPKDAYCADARFAAMPAERIYETLLAEQSQDQSQSQCQAAPGQGQGQGTPAPGSMPSFGDVMDPPADTQEAASAQAGWKQAAVQVEALAKSQEMDSGNVSAHVRQITSVETPWYQLLASWLREQATEDWCFDHPALEWSDSEFIMPSLRSERIGEAWFATDTSGSIDMDVLARFQAEKQLFLDSCRPRKLTDVYCDAQINDVREYEPGEEISCEVSGRGGTDFRPVFELAAERGGVKCLVFLTDLCGTFPEVAPEYPVLWCIYGDGPEPPFGMVVRLAS
jgi:hypothetical protein